MEAVKDGIFLTAEEAKDLSNILWQGGMKVAQKANDGRRANIEGDRTMCRHYLNWSGELVGTKKLQPQGIFLTTEEIGDLQLLLLGCSSSDWVTKLGQVTKQP